MRYRVGATRGTFASGVETPTIVDQGMLTITDHRAVFLGAQQTREWAWEKLVGFHNGEGGQWTGIGVSDSEKISGIAYPPGQAVGTRLFLELGVAASNGTLDAVVADLNSKVIEHSSGQGGSTTGPPVINR